MLFVRNMRRVYFFCFVILVFVLVLSYDVKASTSAGYSVSEIHMRAELNSDGSMDINEFITYKVSPEYEGQIKKYINISRASEVTGLEVSAISSDNPDKTIVETEMMPLIHVDDPTPGQTGIYTYETTNIGQNQFKALDIYLPSGKENVTISLSYRLSDIVYVYRDTSLLQWQFVPQNESDIAGKISIEIILPQNDFNENINAFAHDSQSIIEAVINAESVIFNSNGLRQGDSFDAFVLLPVNAVPNGRKIVDNYILSDMLDLKEHWANQARQAELDQERRKRSVTIAGLILLIAGLGVGSYFYVHSLRKSGKEDFSHQQLDATEHRSKLPEHYYTPAELSVLVNRSKITSRDMIATLMDMVIKGNLLLKADISNECKTLRCVLKEGCHIGRLEPHEEYLINWMLKEVGTGSGFSTLDIESVTANPSLKERFLSKFDTWTRIVIKQATRWNFEQKLSGKPSKLTSFGLEHYSQWMAFKKFLKNFSEESNTQSLADWERFIVYAVPLGEAQHVAARLSSFYPKEAFENENLTLLRRENFELFELWFDCLWEEQ